MVIGIAGGSGSGKTTFAEALCREVGPEHCVMILHDSYYRPTGHLSCEARALLNYDHPDALETELLVTHLAALVRGEAVDAPSYDFTVHDRCSDVVRVEPRPLIIVEGVLCLTDPALRAAMDLKIYVDTDADVRLKRRLRRDIEQRGRTFESVSAQYEATVRPMHAAFVEPSREHADLVIAETDAGKALAQVVAQVGERRGAPRPGEMFGRGR